MKVKLILLIALLVLVAFAAGFSTAARQQWEYQESCGTVGNLNALGQTGWELVGVTYQANEVKCFYLKRPK